MNLSILNETFLKNTNIIADFLCLKRDKFLKKYYTITDLEYNITFDLFNLLSTENKIKVCHSFININKDTEIYNMIYKEKLRIFLNKLLTNK